MNGDRIAKLDKEKHTAERQEDRKWEREGEEEGWEEEKKTQTQQQLFIQTPQSPSNNP